MENLSSHAFTTTDPIATDAFGRRLGSLLFPGAVVALIGPLGAGKTHLTRAIAAGLGVTRLDAVNSPTFVLIQEYDGPIPLYHFDTYRLGNPREFAALGSDEYLYGNGVCVVEWADKVADFLPEDLLTVSLTIIGPTERRIDVSARGPKSTAILSSLTHEG